MLAHGPLFSSTASFILGFVEKLRPMKKQSQRLMQRVRRSRDCRLFEGDDWCRRIAGGGWGRREKWLVLFFPVKSACYESRPVQLTSSSGRFASVSLSSSFYSFFGLESVLKLKVVYQSVMDDLWRFSLACYEQWQFQKLLRPMVMIVVAEFGGVGFREETSSCCGLNCKGSYSVVMMNGVGFEQIGWYDFCIYLMMNDSVKMELWLECYVKKWMCCWKIDEVSVLEENK